MTERSVGSLAAPADPALRIRRAAVLLFAQHGYAATSIRDIAKAVNMTNAGIYHHVTSKEALLADVMRIGHVRLIAATDRLLAGIDRPEKRLATLIASLTAIHALNPMTTQVMDGELRSLTPGTAAHREIIELRDTYEAEWRRTIADGVSRGAFEVADQRLARLALMSVCTGTSEWYRPDGASTLDQVCAQFVSIGLAAVNATGPAAGPHFDPTLLPVYPWEPR
jgi:TetR/AcrR family transcriptional regulator, cholesterol catabolism regulator